MATDQNIKGDFSVYETDDGDNKSGESDK